MKKLLALLLCGAMTAAMLTGCGGGEEKTAGGEENGTVAEESTERTTFTVGFDAEFPPYGYMDDNGEYVGFDLSLAQEVCDRMVSSGIAAIWNFAPCKLELPKNIKLKQENLALSLAYLNNQLINKSEEDIYGNEKL